MCMAFEALYGGAAGGGKSIAMIMAALMYANVPHYRALILRRTFKQFDLALRPELEKFLDGTEAVWDEDSKTYTFPSGAKLIFGYLENERDKERYQGAEFHFVGFEEETQFTKTQYSYVKARCRKKANDPLPLRVRGTTNPGGVGHKWVKKRFITDGKKYGRVFIPAKIEDNPHLNVEAYISNLNDIEDPVLRRQWLHGDWEVAPDGGKFKQSWFHGKWISLKDVPVGLRLCRFWDLAATEAAPGKDPDWTVGTLMGEYFGRFYIIDVKRAQVTPMGIDDLMYKTASDDVHTYGNIVLQAYEEEGGSSGKIATFHFNDIMSEFLFKAVKDTGNKEVRANPFSSACERGSVYVVEDNDWDTTDWLDELLLFPRGEHDDQVDSVSGAYSQLARKRHRPHASTGDE